MFERLFEGFRAKRINDPVFGELRFMRMKDPARSYWEGQGVFPSNNAAIEYLIDADENGPGESQRTLYRRITSEYERIFARLLPILHREYEANLAIPCPSSLEFKLEGLSIPREETPDMEWDLDYSCGPNEDWLFTVHMRGWKPTGKVSAMH